MERKVKRIAEYNWHQFIYMENDEERKRVLEMFDREYKIKAGEKTPMTVSITTDSLLTRETMISPYGDIVRLQSCAREQLAFTIAVAILEKMKRDIPDNQLGDVVTNILNYINRIFLDKQHPPIESLDDLIRIFKKSADFYRTNFLKEQKKEDLDDIRSLEVPFLDIVWFVSFAKKSLKNGAHFAVLIDYQSKLGAFSYQALNNLIAMRITSDISVKVVQEPGDWEQFLDMAGNKIDTPHDYGTEDLDGSLKRYIEEQKRAFYEQDTDELGGFVEDPAEFDGDFTAFNYCLATDYLAALLDEDFDRLGKMSCDLFDTIVYWLNYDGEIGKDNISLIESIPTGKFLTSKGRSFEEAVIENRNASIAESLIYNGNNNNIELYMTVILNGKTICDEDDILNCIHSSSPELDVDEYCNFLEGIFNRIGEKYEELQGPKEKEQLLKTIIPYLKGIRMPNSFRDSIRLKEIASMKKQGWQIKLREMI